MEFAYVRPASSSENYLYYYLYFYILFILEIKSLYPHKIHHMSENEINI